jgi:hypothetical protein
VITRVFAAAVAICLGVNGGMAFGQVKAGAEVKPGAEGIAQLRSIQGLGARGKVKTPEYRTSVSGGRVAPRDWQNVVALYDTNPEWVDELTFQFYVLLYKETQGKKEYSLCKGTVSYVDIAKGRRHVSEVFLRPTTVARHGEVVGIAVEMLSKGELIGAESDAISGLPKEWWKNPNLTVRDGLLLSRSQTPFTYINWDDFEVIK